MAPSINLTSGVLRQAVYYHLDNSLYESALFFAERLGVQDKSTEPTFLLALCHLRLGDHRSAYEVSKAAGYRGTHVGCAYIFALACLELDLHKEGIAALEKSKGLWLGRNNMGKHSAYSRVPHPDAAACSCLLGKLYRAADDKRKAVASFEDALKANPFMWDAFTSLCDMGVGVKVANAFRMNEAVVRNLEQELNGAATERRDLSNPVELQLKRAAARPAIHDPSDPFDQQRPAGFQDLSTFGNLQAADAEEHDLLSKIAAARSRIAADGSTSHGSDGMETPTGPGAASGHSSRMGLNPEPPQAPTRRTRPAQAADQSLLDAPPRMSYRLGSKRRDKGQDSTNEGSADQGAVLRTSALSISATERKRTVSGHPVQPRHVHAEEPGAPQRRSARLNMFKPSVAKTNSASTTMGNTTARELKKARAPISRIMRQGSSGSHVGRVVSGNRARIEENSMDIDHAEASAVKEAHHPRPAPKVAEPEPIRMDEVVRSALDLLRKLGMGYVQLTQFRCHDAVQTFCSLPRSQQDTPWVLAQLGRAQYEQANYAEAEKYFRRLRMLAPTRLQDMEVYSTILWFLKKETDLSFLAHELVDSCWHSPQAWCALGNAWSLALDHEQALRCFKRATQLDPKFAYAFTLQGHEHVLTEEFDKALTAYRQAISADRRHYNAYYGIGKVYEKLGNYDKAYTHYHAASVIHPTNAVLVCCIGTVLEKQKQIVQALQHFSKATDLAPRAAQTRFKKARALLAIGQLPAAQRELMILKDLAPDEARVHFLLGKLYKTLNDKSQAVWHFTQALSLDPKASQQIKEAIESLEEDDGFDDSMIQ